MNFKELSPAQRKEYARRAHIARRTPEAQAAWENMKQIRQDAKTMSIAELCRKYKVKNRTMRRWVGYGQKITN